MRIVVVGGGIAGLAAAYRLKDRAEVILLEASGRVGGVIRTRIQGDYLMEAGPDAFIDKGTVLQLCRELGLEQQLIRTSQAYRRSFMVRGRRLLPVPEGLYLMAPSALGPFLRSPIVSPLGKARMLLDLVARRRAAPDESLASFVRRRLGQEALDRLAQPLLGGIYAADPERLSLAATMPQFLDMERRHGSVVRALLTARRSTGPGTSGARYALFHSFGEGMEILVSALRAALPDVRLNTAVQGLDRVEGGWRVRFGNSSEGGDAELVADGVCLCVPPAAAASWLPGLPLPAAPRSSVVTVNLGFREEQVRHPLNGAGFVVPHSEGRSIIACSFSSRKFEGRSQPGHVLLRAFVGGMLGRRHYEIDDEQLVANVLNDLDELLDVDGPPEEVWLNRLPDSMPQYEVGHLDRMAALETALERLPGLALAGNSYRGVGIPDCIASGFAAADRLLGAPIPGSP